MAHYCMYQITADKEMEPFDTIEIFDLIDSTPIDYVGELKPEFKDRCWDDLMIGLKPYGIDYDKNNKTVVFQKGFKQAYFKTKYKLFKELAAEIDLAEFAEDNGLSHKLYSLTSLIENIFGDYVINEYAKTFDEFVRSIGEGLVYYLVDIFDCHM